MPTTINKQPNRVDIHEIHNMSHGENYHRVNMTEGDGRRARNDSTSPHQEISPLSISQAQQLAMNPQFRNSKNRKLYTSVGAYSKQQQDAAMAINLMQRNLGIVQ